MRFFFTYLRTKSNFFPAQINCQGFISETKNGQGFDPALTFAMQVVLKAETAISHLPYAEQEHLRFQFAHSLKLLYKYHDNSQRYNTRDTVKERHILHNIKNKLEKRITFILAPCISMIQLFSHTNICTCIIYY
jgi:hypothetical protein